MVETPTQPAPRLSIDQQCGKNLDLPKYLIGPSKTFHYNDTISSIFPRGPLAYSFAPAPSILSTVSANALKIAWVRRSPLVPKCAPLKKERMKLGQIEHKRRWREARLTS